MQSCLEFHPLAEDSAVSPTKGASPNIQLRLIAGTLPITAPQAQQQATDREAIEQADNTVDQVGPEARSWMEKPARKAGKYQTDQANSSQRVRTWRLLSKNHFLILSLRIM